MGTVGAVFAAVLKPLCAVCAAVTSDVGVLRSYGGQTRAEQLMPGDAAAML